MLLLKNPSTVEGIVIGMRLLAEARDLACSWLHPACTGLTPAADSDFPPAVPKTPTFHRRVPGPCSCHYVCRLCECCLPVAARTTVDLLYFCKTMQETAVASPLFGRTSSLPD